MERVLVGALRAEAGGRVPDQPRAEFEAEYLLVLLLPGVPGEFVAQQVVVPVSGGLGQVPVGHGVVECLPDREPRAEGVGSLRAQGQQFMDGVGGVRVGQGAAAWESDRDQLALR